MAEATVVAAAAAVETVGQATVAVAVSLVATDARW